MGALQDAIAKIDALVEALQSGKLISASVEPPQGAAAAAAAAAAPDDAAKVAAAPDQPPQAKKVKAAKVAKPAAPVEDPLTKAQLAVARVASVTDHPSGSDKLWLCQVEVGGGATRQVVAGLKKHISAEELSGRLVAVVLNLKAAKLAGELSEAMILAACSTLPQGGELVRPVEVPAGASAGDPIYLEASQPCAEYPKTCKTEQWRKVTAELRAADGAALFAGQRLVTAAGPLSVAADVPTGAAIQ